MKEKVSPVVAVLVILAVVGIAVLAWMKFGGVARDENAKPPPMPSDASAEFQKRMGGGGGVTGPPAGTGGTPGGGPPSGVGVPMTGPPGGTAPGGGGSGP